MILSHSPAPWMLLRQGQALCLANTALSSLVSNNPSCGDQASRHETSKSRYFASTSNPSQNSSSSSSNTPPAAPAGNGSSSADSTIPLWPLVDQTRGHVLPRYVDKGEKRQVMALYDAILQVQANIAERRRNQERNRRRTIDETFELTLRLGVDARKGDQVVRGAVVLPHGTGKPVRIAVFARGADAELAKALGADVVGADDLIASIQASGGKSIDFDKCIATPDFMRLLAGVGKILGPKGLMPNPKLGTLTSDVGRALREMRAGRLEFRVDPTNIMHAALGKMSMGPDKLMLNAGAFLTTLLELRPKAVAGEGMDGYIFKAFVKSTFTASVPLVLDSLAEALQLAKAYNNTMAPPPTTAAATAPAATPEPTAPTGSAASN